MPPSNSQTRRRSHALRALATLTITIGTIGLPVAASAAGPTLAISPLEWNVVGLDSNSPASGPNRFHIGALVCNTGDAPATSIEAAWSWDTEGSAVSLQGPAVRSLTDLEPGACASAWFGLQVEPQASSYDATREFHITATATGAGVFDQYGALLGIATAQHNQPASVYLAIPATAFSQMRSRTK